MAFTALLPLLLSGCTASQRFADTCEQSGDCAQDGLCVEHVCVPGQWLTVEKAGLGRGEIVSEPAGIHCGKTCLGRFAEGTEVTLTATPAENVRFDGWSGACSGNGLCRVVLTRASTVQAKFTPMSQVTVTVSGEGQGSVTSDPPGINCRPGQTCTAWFETGQRVVVSAIADMGSRALDCTARTSYANCGVYSPGSVAVRFEPMRPIRIVSQSPSVQTVKPGEPVHLELVVEEPNDESVVFSWNYSHGSLQNYGGSYRRSSSVDWILPHCQHEGETFTADVSAGNIYSHVRARFSVNISRICDGRQSAGTMAVLRAGHTATLLPSGRVLIAGGSAESPSAELYGPDITAWSATGPMLLPRAFHAATLLSSGKVLVTGGREPNGAASLTNAELYDPATGTWSQTRPMRIARSFHSAVLLSSGKVLVTGGSADATSELYDPVEETWSDAGVMIQPHDRPATVLLSSGNVMLVGNGTSELYDTAAGAWRPVSALDCNGRAHLWLLSTGRAQLVEECQRPPFEHAWQLREFDEQAERWSTPIGTSSRQEREFLATRLPSGEILLTGGVNHYGVHGSRQRVIDPITGALTDTFTMTVARNEHRATLLPSGAVLITGGSAYSRAAELYLPWH